MDLAVIGYLLFIIPGFCLVWTYRHFTKAKQIGDFEYAAWSFLWGSIMFFSTAKILEFRHASLPPISTNNPLLFAAAFLGIGLGTVIGLAFPLGYVATLLLGLFKGIDKALFWLMGKITGVPASAVPTRQAGEDATLKANGVHQNGTSSNNSQRLWPLMVAALLTFVATTGYAWFDDKIFVTPVMKSNLLVEVEYDQHYINNQTPAIQEAINDISSNVPNITAPPSGDLNDYIFQSYLNLNQLNLLDDNIREAVLTYYENIHRIDYIEKIVALTLTQYTSKLASKSNAIDSLSHLLNLNASTTIEGNNLIQFLKSTK